MNMSDQNFQDDQSTERSLERREAELNEADRTRKVHSPAVISEAERVVDARSFIDDSVPDPEAFNQFADLTGTDDLPRWLADSVSTARQTISSAFDAITSLANHSEYAPVRAENIRQRQAEARKAAQDVAEAAELRLKIDQARAYTEALELPTGRAATDLFHEAKAYMSMAKDPAATFETLVSRGDDVAKLLASAKGKAMLIALGVENADALHSGAGKSIIESLARRGDAAATRALDLAPGGRTYHQASRAVQALAGLAKVTAEGRGRKGRA